MADKETERGKDGVDEELCREKVQAVLDEFDCVLNMTVRSTLVNIDGRACYVQVPEAEVQKKKPGLFLANGSATDAALRRVNGGLGGARR